MKKNFFCLLLLNLSFAFFCQEVELLNLTVDKAVEIALENNISIKKSSIELEKAKIADKFSWNSISPSFQAGGTYTSSLEENSDTFSITGTASLNLFTNLFSTMRAARLNYESGLMSFEEAKRSVELSVRKTFYGLLYEKDNIELQKRGLETSFKQYKTNQEKFANGKISELDVMTTKVRYEQKKPLVESAEITYRNDLASFKQVLGIDQSVEIELSGNLDDVLSLKNISFESLPVSQKPAPEVQSAEKSVEIAKNNLLASRFSAYGPSISASFTLTENNSHVRDAISQQPTSEREWGDLAKTLRVGVNIPLDGYIPWSSSAAQVQNQKKSVKSAELSLENARTSVQIKTENYLRKINQSISQVTSLKSNVQLAEETYSLTQTAYNYGKTDLLSLQNASDSVLSAQVSVKQQAYSLISSILDLENLLGIDFGSLTK